MSKKKDRSSDLPVIPVEWVPVRRGKFFCSPQCGSHCTKVEYDKAYRGSVTLVMLLKGSGWRGEVWESPIDWRFKATSGPLTVFGDFFGKSGQARYACTMLGRQPDNFVSDDPNEAVAHILDHCIAGANSALETLFDACTVGDRLSEFFRVFSQHKAVEFLRYPEGRSLEEAARFALGKHKVSAKRGKKAK